MDVIRHETQSLSLPNGTGHNDGRRLDLGDAVKLENVFFWHQVNLNSVTLNMI
jgi:hypothetical protein